MQIKAIIFFLLQNFPEAPVVYTDTYISIQTIFCRYKDYITTKVSFICALRPFIEECRIIQTHITAESLQEALWQTSFNMN